MPSVPFSRFGRPPELGVVLLPTEHLRQRPSPGPGAGPRGSAAVAAGHRVWEALSLGLRGEGEALVSACRPDNFRT